MTEIVIGSLVDIDAETEDKIIDISFDNRGISFIQSVGKDTELRLAVDTENAIPGNYSVEFIITEEFKGVIEETKKEIKIRIPANTEPGDDLD